MSFQHTHNYTSSYARAPVSAILPLHARLYMLTLCSNCVAPEEAKYLAAIQRLEEQFQGTMDTDWREAQQRSSTTGYAKAAGGSGSRDGSAGSSMDEADAVQLRRPTKPAKVSKASSGCKMQCC